jgi:hypothetical protein
MTAADNYFTFEQLHSVAAEIASKYMTEENAQGRSGPFASDLSAEQVQQIFEDVLQISAEESASIHDSMSADLACVHALSIQLCCLQYKYL